MACRAARGAITAENTHDSILQNTKEMLEYIIQENRISVEDIISILFTCTKDLDAVYPAVAARGLGITESALFCTQEMYVVGSLEKCIRVLVTFESDLAQKEIRHAYLKGAKKLRPDLINN